MMNNSDQNSDEVKTMLTEIYHYLGMALAYNAYDDVELPAAMRQFLFKKRPLPNADDFRNLMTKDKIRLNISDQMAGRPILNGPNDYHTESISLVSDKKEYGHARVSSIFYRASAKDRIIALCNHNYYGFIATNSTPDQLHNSYQKPTAADIKLFEAVLAALKEQNKKEGLNVKPLYYGYSNTLKDIIKSPKLKYSALQDSDISSLHNATQNMIVTVLTDNLDGTYGETNEYHGDYDRNYDDALNEAKAVKDSSHLYRKHKIFIYYSNFEPLEIGLKRINFAVHRRDGYKEVISIRHLDAPNTVIILAPDKKEADQQFRNWLKEKGWDSSIKLADDSQA